MDDKKKILSDYKKSQAEAMDNSIESIDVYLKGITRIVNRLKSGKSEDVDVVALSRAAGLLSALSGSALSVREQLSEMAHIVVPQPGWSNKGSK